MELSDSTDDEDEAPSKASPGVRDYVLLGRFLEPPAQGPFEQGVASGMRKELTFSGSRPS